MGAGGIKVPTQPSTAGGWDFLGFSSGMLQLLPQMVSFLSTMYLKASERDQIVELDCKDEFFFSFFFSPQVKNWVHEDEEEKQMIRVYKNLHLDNLEEFCVDVCTFAYYYSNLAINMNINFYFLTLSTLFKKNERLDKLYVSFSIALD